MGKPFSFPKKSQRVGLVVFHQNHKKEVRLVAFSKITRALQFFQTKSRHFFWQKCQGVTLSQNNKGSLVAGFLQNNHKFFKKYHPICSPKLQEVRLVAFPKSQVVSLAVFQKIVQGVSQPCCSFPKKVTRGKPCSFPQKLQRVIFVVFPLNHKGLDLQLFIYSSILTSCENFPHFVQLFFPSTR